MLMYHYVTNSFRIYVVQCNTSSNYPYTPRSFDPPNKPEAELCAHVHRITLPSFSCLKTLHPLSSLQDIFFVPWAKFVKFYPNLVNVHLYMLENLVKLNGITPNRH